MKMKARRGLVPVSLMHPSLVPTDRKVPPGLSPTVTATIWKKHGDHPAVMKVPPFPLADVNEIVTVKAGKVELYKGKPAVPAPEREGVTPPDGERFMQIRMCDALIRREDEHGYAYDYLVMPGFYIIENDSDGIVWALNPFLAKAWFEEAK
jgi:hypothetical protein